MSPELWCNHWEPPNGSWCMGRCSGSLRETWCNSGPVWSAQETSETLWRMHNVLQELRESYYRCKWHTWSSLRHPGRISVLWKADCSPAGDMDIDLDTSRALTNDSTSDATDQSGLELFSLVQVQSKQILDQDWSNLQFVGMSTDSACTALNQSTRTESAQIHREL